MNFFHVVGLDDPNQINVSDNKSYDSKDWEQMLKFKGQENNNFNLNDSLKKELTQIFIDIY